MDPLTVYLQGIGILINPLDRLLTGLEDLLKIRIREERIIDDHRNRPIGTKTIGDKTENLCIQGVPETSVDKNLNCTIVGLLRIRKYIESPVFSFGIGNVRLATVLARAWRLIFSLKVNNS